MAATQGSAFKARPEHLYLHPRPRSPIAPVFEPLSPLLPVEPTCNYPPLPSNHWQVNQPAQEYGYRSDQVHGLPQNGIQSPRNAPHQRKFSNTIEELAHVALAASPPYATKPRKISAPHYISQEPLSYNGVAHAGGVPSQYAMDWRPNKRARSEAGPPPATYPSFSSRPITSYTSQQIQAYNLGQRAYQSDASRRRSTTSKLEDAELLLNFANRLTSKNVEPPAPTQQAHQPMAAAVPHSTQEEPELPSQLSAPRQQAHQPTVPAIPHPIQEEPELSIQSLHDPSASLPSPRETSDEAREAMGNPKTGAVQEEVKKVQEEVRPETQRASTPQQTQTPPEDEQSSSNDAEQAVVVAQDKPANVELSVVEPKPKAADSGKKPTKRGWPKGKPRGPKKSAAAAKLRQSTGKRGRKAGGPAKSDERDTPPRARRKSEVDIYLAHGELVIDPRTRSASVPPSCAYIPGKPKSNAGRKPLPKFTPDTVCAECQKQRDSSTGEHDQWISCNSCKHWLHSDCAGFQNMRDVRDVDKFFCKKCEPKHGPTTFVRKSSRAHTAVDYAGLNQGELRTSDDCNEHHYIQPIKDGTYKFDAEDFPRMRPELVTAEYFERSSMFDQPVLIPAEFNPPRRSYKGNPPDYIGEPKDRQYNIGEEEALPEAFEYETALDDGQDKLDMVIPQDLTVRRVAELVGPDYPLEVIDVKVQGMEGGKWNLQKWADYYEMEGEKAIRNVISLEVSETKLGRLLRRPKLVRQIDLQDNVWPKDEEKKSVAFYCLMSAADSYTDFHIDFGGSSVYYHILRGSKTFFFIPPKPKHLKAYEDWNNSPQQNFTFLPSLTRECYRVDLSEGDTMLIPSGWIHAVWTPANSLVIGGNFLTHMHYSMQFKIGEIEKANKTPLKFRYPKFQKVMWYSVMKYLKEDPLPEAVRDSFYSGAKFERETPVWQDFETHSVLSGPGSAHYNSRYYSQMELNGLPDLVSFIFRTVMISLDRIENISEKTRAAVKGSIPKSYGEPLDLARTFALWTAWKRGNEDPPAWAHPEAVLPEKEGNPPKKLSAKMLRDMQRQEAIEAYRVVPDRQSARQQEAAQKAEAAATIAAAIAATTAAAQAREDAKAEGEAASARASHASPTHATTDDQAAGLASFTSTPKTSVLGPKRIACDACRKRRIRCKHKDSVTGEDESLTTPVKNDLMDVSQSSAEPDTIVVQPAVKRTKTLEPNFDQVHFTPQAHVAVEPSYLAPDTETPDSSGITAEGTAKRGRSKACTDCRKSKRRCIHDESGRVDPVKEKQTPVPRSNVPKKRKSSGEASSSPEQKKPKQRTQSELTMMPPYQPPHSQQKEDDVMPLDPALRESTIESTIHVQPARLAPQHEQAGPDCHQPLQWINQQLPGLAPYGSNNDFRRQVSDTNIDPAFSIGSLQQFANDVLDYNADGASQGLAPYVAEAERVHSPIEAIMTAQSMHFDPPADKPKAMDSNESVDSGISLPDGASSKEPASIDQRYAGDEHDLHIVNSKAVMPIDANGVAARSTEEAPTDVNDTIRVVPSAEPLRTCSTDQAAAHPVTPENKSEVMPQQPDVAQTVETEAAAAAPIVGAVQPSVQKSEPANGDRGETDIIDTRASSPLSDISSPAPESLTIPMSHPPSTARISSRQSKPVERFSNTTYEGSYERLRTPSAVGLGLSNVSASPVKKRKSSTPGPASVTPKKARTGVGLDGFMNGHGNGNGYGEMISAEHSLEDEESLKLARELQGENFGLRARRSVGA